MLSRIYAKIKSSRIKSVLQYLVICSQYIVFEHKLYAPMVGWGTNHLVISLLIAHATTGLNQRYFILSIVLRMSATVFFFPKIRVFFRLFQTTVSEWGSIGKTLNFFNNDTNLLVLNMEDDCVLRYLVNYFKNCNTPSFNFLHFKVVIITTLIE